MKRWKVITYLEDSEKFGPITKEEIHESYNKAARTLESKWNGLTVTDWDVEEDE